MNNGTPTARLALRPPAALEPLVAASALIGAITLCIFLDPAMLPGATPRGTEEPAWVPLVALSAAIMVAFRTILGLPTLGTFAPVLLSLAFLSSGLGVGLLIVAVLVGGGLMLEPRMRRARLPRVARLGVMIASAASILVVLGAAGVPVANDAIQMPLVATVMVIERLWEDLSASGPRRAATSGLATLAVGCLTLAVLDGPLVGSAASTWPLLVTAIAAAAAWAAGSYRGLRVLELRRFGPLHDTGAGA